MTSEPDPSAAHPSAVLDDAGIVRSGIRSSFGGSTTTAPGVALRIALTLTDTAGAALAGAAVYLWGPTCGYPGRWPHVHVEVYRSLADATSSGNAVTTTQLALPQDVCEAVYATDGNAASRANLARVGLDSDRVFCDGWDRQPGTVTGDVAGGLIVSLPVAV